MVAVRDRESLFVARLTERPEEIKIASLASALAALGDMYVFKNEWAEFDALLSNLPESSVVLVQLKMSHRVTDM